MSPTAMTVPDTTKIETDASAYLALATKLIVDSDAVQQDAAKHLLEIRDLQSEIDATFDAPIAAAWRAHKTICAARKKHSEPLEKASALLRKKIGDFQQQREQRALIEHRAAQAEAEKVARETDTPVAAVVPTAIAQKPDGVSMRTIWKYEVIDATKLPREYMIPNEKMLGEIVRAMGGETKISGVKVWSEKSVSVR